MAQNAMTAASPVDTEHIQEKAVEAKASMRELVYNTSAAVSNAILVTLGMGLLLQTIAGFINWAPMVQMGAITKIMLPAAFGAAVASQMKTNTMVMFSAMAASTVGANAVFFSSSAVQGVTATGYAGSQAAGSAIITTGQPISAVLAAVIAVVFGKWLSGKTPLDMVIVPAATTIVGTVSGYYLAMITTPALVAVGQFIAASIAISPIIGTAVVAPIATMVFHVTAPFAMAGIGFNSFIVPLALAGSNPIAFAAYMVIGVAIPMVVSFVGYRLMRKMGWAKPNQLHLEMI